MTPTKKNSFASFAQLGSKIRFLFLRFFLFLLNIYRFFFPSTLHNPPAALTSLLLRGHAAVTVDGQGPGRRADAVVRARSVHAVAVLTVERVLALIHVCGAQRFTQSPA